MIESNSDSCPPWCSQEYKFAGLFEILKKGTLELLEYSGGGAEVDVEAVKVAEWWISCWLYEKSPFPV